MSTTLYDKIWNDHLVDQQEDGTALLFVDRHLVHEVTSPQAFEGLRNSNRKVRHPNLTLAVADHNVPTTDRTKGISDQDSKIQVDTLEDNCKEFEFGNKWGKTNLFCRILEFRHNLENYFKEKRETLGLPLFVIFFIGAVVLNFLFSFSEEVTTSLASINRGCLTIGLFCIGTQIDKEAIRNISIRPVLQALSLWFVVIIASLAILT